MGIDTKCYVPVETKVKCLETHPSNLKKRQLLLPEGAKTYRFSSGININTLQVLVSKKNPRHHFYTGREMSQSLLCTRNSWKLAFDFPSASRVPTKTILIRSICAAIVCLTFPSCMVGPDYSQPDVSLQRNWIQRRDVAKSAGPSPDSAWWKAFRDPVLNRLVDMACRNNLSLQAAGARIFQARAQFNQSKGNLLPQDQALSGGIDYRRINVNSQSSGDVLPGGLVSSLDPNLGRLLPSLDIDPNIFADDALFAASWEIDFWGKYRREIQSAGAGYLSSVAAYQDSLVTLQADVASAYVNIRTFQERIVVNQRNVESQEGVLEIAEARFEGGETSELDVDQAKTNLAETKAQVPSLKNSLRQAKNGLAVLLGVTPDKVDGLLKGSSGIPAAPSRIEAGIPRDLLRRRPDVREAGLNAAAQSAQIGVAKAQLYPAFSLSGAFGFASSNSGDASLDNIFNWNNRVVKAGGSFLFPVFNYGRLTNQVRIQDAAFQQAVLNYQNTVLVAQQEVENGLSSYRYGKEALALLDQASVSSKKSEDLAVIQYRGGQTDYTTVLNAEQAQLRIEDSFVSAKGNVLLAIISVYRSLGGGWEFRSGDPVVSANVKKQMESRTNWGNMLEPEKEKISRSKKLAAKQTRNSR